MTVIEKPIKLPKDFIIPDRKSSDNFRVRDFSFEINSNWARAIKSKVKFTKLDFAHYSLVLNNGFFDEGLSDLPKTVKVVHNSFKHDGLRTSNRISPALFDLNLANAHEQLSVFVADDTELDKPICLYYINSNNVFCSPRIEVNLGDNSKVTVIEQVIGDVKFWCNAVLQLNLAPNATCAHYQLADVGPAARVMQNLIVNQSINSSYTAFNLQSGGDWQRLSLHINMQQAARCDIKGLMLAAQKSNLQQNLFVEHLGDNTISAQQYRALAASGRVSFLGRVTADKNLHSISAQQKSDHLLLENSAQSDNQPQLQIYTEDVSCSHGATVGALDKDAIFYLCARGLGLKQAQRLLASAFTEELILSLPDYLQSYARQQVARALIVCYKGEHNA